MDAGTESKLETFLQRFTAEIEEWGALMLETLAKDGFEVTFAYGIAPRAWLLHAKPPLHIQEEFGLAPEILLVAVRGEVQARDLERAANEVVHAGLRLDSNLVVVTDDVLGQPLQERLDRIPGRGQRVAWIWNQVHWPKLSDVFRQRLPTYDVFEERDPVRGYQLMGRDIEVAELRTRVVRGDAVGVFGLRKMGKTSLVRAVTDALDPASGIQGVKEEEAISQAWVIWIDAQTLDQDAGVDDIADEMLAALRRRMRAARASSYKPPERQGVAGFKLAGEALLDKGMQLCFVIDEYDYLFEREGGRGAVPGLSRLFRLLRGWAQQWQGAVSLVLIGRDPEHLSTPQLDGVTNPLLAWFTPVWLGPLAPPRDRDLLRKLGRRVGLDVGHQTAELAHRWTFGHPMLHRQFGSALREEVRKRVPSPSRKVATDLYCDDALVRFQDRDAVLTVDREIVELLRKRYMAAYELVLDLASGGGAAAAVTRAGGLHGAGARTLRRFGLLEEATLALPEHLAWYVRTFLALPTRVAV